MIRTIALLCVIAAPALAGTFRGAWGPGLRARFDTTGFGDTSFIHLPQSALAAASKGWVTVDRPTSPQGLEILSLRCPPSDYAVCIFTDDTGYIAGVQIALDIDNYSGNVYDMKVHGFTHWSVEVNCETKNYWTAQQYYISASTLAIDPSIRIARRDPATILQDGAIWVSGFNGELSRMSANITELTSEDSIYKEQACIPLMGLHYYYNMTTEAICQADTMFLWFPLIQTNQLIGVGFVTYGKINIPEGQTNWFEEPVRAAVEAIVPRGPQCLYELIEAAGAVTMHTYFIENPLLINCVIQ